MTPETGYFLAKARRLLAEAEGMLAAGYSDAAGRSAYLAGFRAAQVLISERTGKATKTHQGVRTEFHRLTRNEPRINRSLRGFLGFAYNLKAIADYETGPGSEVPAEKAAQAIAEAKLFVGAIETLLATP